MICKDEAPVIVRCLNSVRPFITHWVIVDTGSTDGTQDIIKNTMEGIPGTLYERPWVNFAHNRTEALHLAKPHGDYTLIIDADDMLVPNDGFVMPELESDAYNVRIDFGPIVYFRPQLIRSCLGWVWRGVVHEFLACPDTSTTAGMLEGLTLKINQDGHRRGESDTYQRDAVLLEEALKTEEDPFLRSRYTFYLAQSYRDGGDLEKPIQYYLQRAELGFWDEEVFLSYLYAGRMHSHLGKVDEALELFRKAIQSCPRRAEASFEASILCSRLNRHQEAYEFIRPALWAQPPDGGLFIELWIYERGIEDQYAATCYWTGQYKESLDHCLNLLSRPDVSNFDRQRIEQNARFSLQNLN
jgi:tetratricopeptide (TPR) repeat protein